MVLMEPLLGEGADEEVVKWGSWGQGCPSGKTPSTSLLLLSERLHPKKDSVLLARSPDGNKRREN